MEAIFQAAIERPPNITMGELATPVAQVALRYKELWMVERLFRDTKTLLKTRPVFHKRD